MASVSNRRLIGILSVTVVGMFGLGFAMVPLYSLICDVTGINSISNSSGQVTLEQATAAGIDYERMVKVDFDVTLNAELDWEVRPAIKRMEVHPGKSYQVSYYAKNNSDRTITAQAVPSITPWQATAHFNKIECFCFTQQKLAPGEEKEMPLRFVLDQKLPDQYKNFTLSYTFMDIDRLKMKQSQQATAVTEKIKGDSSS